MFKPTDPQTLAALMARRSVRPRRLAAPGPAEESLNLIIAAGYRGIDHGRLRGWRVILIEDREKLADVFANARRETMPNADAGALDTAREQAKGGPVLLALVHSIDLEQPTVPVHEQWMAVGAAAQNMLLAAEALGFSGSLLSGRKTQSNALRTAFGLGTNESLVGFLTFGTALPAMKNADANKSPNPLPQSAITKWP